MTADQNLAYQQNLTERQIGVLIVSTNNWDRLKACSDDIATLVRSFALDKTVARIDVGRPGQSSDVLRGRPR